MFFYCSGFFAQFWYNRASGAWPSFWPHKCAGALLSPSGLLGILITLFLAIVGVLIFWLRQRRYADLEYDPERNFYFSKQGSYGTATWMKPEQVDEVFDRTPISDIDRVDGDILGILGEDVISLPADTMYNGHTAVYGSSGSMKSRAYVMNRIITAAKRGHSVVLTDSKGTLYRETSEYMREQGYTIRCLNLINPELSHKWNFLQEIKDAGRGREDLMAQLETETIITNTSGERSDHFWDAAEQNLLKALVLYQLHAHKNDSAPLTMERVMKLLAPEPDPNPDPSIKKPSNLDVLFENLKDDPASQPFSIFQRASETVRGNVIVGLGSRLQIFTNKLICEMTSKNEIDLELPGKEKCCYYVIISDQDRSLDFLSALFFSIFLIKLTRFADTKTETGRCPVPVHFVLDEVCNIGKIPLGTSLSSVRSRGLTISPIFQSISQLQNRYPHNEYLEILANCDLQLCMAVADELTAKTVSERTGVVTIGVNSTGRQRNIWSITDYVPDYRENRSVGKRMLLTPDEVMRLPTNELLIMLRGQQVLKAEKFDYSRHPESAKFKPVPMSIDVPEPSDTAAQLFADAPMEGQKAPPQKEKPQEKSKKPQEQVIGEDGVSYTNYSEAVFNTRSSHVPDL